MFIIIKRDQIDEAKKVLPVDKYYWKFLYDTDDEDVEGLNLLTDSLMFSGFSSIISKIKVKQKSVELYNEVKKLVGNILDDSRHMGLINDALNERNIIFVIGSRFEDKAYSKKSVILNGHTLDMIIEEFTKEIRIREGMILYNLEVYKSGIDIDEQRDYDVFLNTQTIIETDSMRKVEQDFRMRFIKLYKIRLLPIYAKLKDFSLEDIMRQLERLGYIDDSFDGEYIFEDKARQLLAKRLTVLSFRNDINQMISTGLMKPEEITYNLDI